MAEDAADDGSTEELTAGKLKMLSGGGASAAAAAAAVDEDATQALPPKVDDSKLGQSGPLQTLPDVFGKRIFFADSLPARAEMRRTAAALGARVDEYIFDDTEIVVAARRDDMLTDALADNAKLRAVNAYWFEKSLSAGKEQDIDAFALTVVSDGGETSEK